MQRIGFSSILAACMLLVVVTGTPARAAEGGVGVVAEYRPAAGRFVFTRASGDEQIPVRIGAVVQAGDSVSLPAGAVVTLQLANGETTVFEGPGSHSVPDARPLGRLAAVFRSMPRLFDDEYRLSGTAASRGGEPCVEAGRSVAPIEVPILVPGASVIARKRDLPLAWRGGCAPFVVQVLAGNDGVVHRESIEGRQVRLDDVPLVPGRYRVVITDQGGRRYENSLEAVAQGPAMPDELAADTSALGTVAQAVWYADLDGGRWRLESFERLRPLIRAGDPLAGALGDGVLWGTANP